MKKTGRSYYLHGFSRDITKLTDINIKKTKLNDTKFIDDRRKMMTVWADYLDQLKEMKPGSNVVQFQKAR